MQQLALRVFGTIGLLSVVFGLGGWSGHSWTAARYDAKIATIKADGVAATERIEDLWQQAFNYNAKRLTDENLAIDQRLQSALVELRKRPMRSAEAANTRPACTGANGLELAGEYAEFLARYAALAAKQDAALTECYANLDVLLKEE